MVQRVIHAMAMPFTFDVSGPDGAAIDRALDLIDADYQWVNEVFSIWLADSPVSRLGRGEIAIGDCPPEVSEVREQCRRFTELTGGAFEALRPDGVWDPTGLVKTWAVERSLWRLDTAGASEWLIGASGDVLVSGVKPDGSAWRTGISHPGVSGDPTRQALVDVVELAGERRALATSGSAQHGAHIWDPATGLPAQHYDQVSVVGPSLVEADVWATGIVAGGPEVAIEAQKHGFEVLCINGTTGPLTAVQSPGWPSVAG